MEDLSQRLERLQDECAKISDSAKSMSQEGLKTLQLRRESFPADMVSALCETIAPRIAHHIEAQNATTQEKLVSIEDDLGAAVCSFEFLSTSRGRFFDLYNSVTQPQLLEVDQRQTTVGAEGFNLATVDSIQKSTQNAVGRINALRDDHEILFSDLQQAIISQMTLPFKQLEARMVDHHIAFCRQVDESMSECLQELTKARDILNQIQAIRQKVQGIFPQDRLTVA